jgi:hypothetical protein
MWIRFAVLLELQELAAFPQVVSVQVLKNPASSLTPGKVWAGLKSKVSGTFE